MKRVLLSVFLTSLALHSAQAAIVNVDIYGALNLDVEQVSMKGATTTTSNMGDRNRVVSNASNIGFKGEETLDGAWKFVWQVESSINPTGGTTSSYVGLASRNSGVGLSHATYGTLMLGKWDTPYKILHNFIEPMYAVGVGYMVSILDTAGQTSTSMDSPSSGASTASTVRVAESLSFSRRQGQAIHYTSPMWNDLQLKVMYSPNVDRTSNTNPYLLSSSLYLAKGAVKAGVAYEKHSDFMAGQTSTLPYAGSSNNTKDRAYKAALGYKFDCGLSLGAAFSNLRYESQNTTTPTQTNSYERNAYMATATHVMNRVTLRAGYGWAEKGKCSEFTAAGAACSVADMGAKQMVFGTSYAMSGRTDLYAVYSQIQNETNATYVFAQNPVTTTAVAGGDPRAIGLGLRHTF